MVLIWDAASSVLALTETPLLELICGFCGVVRRSAVAGQLTAVCFFLEVTVREMQKMLCFFFFSWSIR